MALVTVQRTPSPHRGLDNEENDGSEGGSKQSQGHKSRRAQTSLKKLAKTVNTIKFVNRLRFSESYFTIKGAALILPKSDKLPLQRKKSKYKHKTSVEVTGLQTHLQCMFHELRPDDTIHVAIKLETSTEYTRYLAIVVTDGVQETVEAVILGFHCTDSSAQLGLVLPIYQDTTIALDGDGVQAMWSALLSLRKVYEIAVKNSYSDRGPTHQWISYYNKKITNEQKLINEWDYLDDLMVTRADYTPAHHGNDSIEYQIRSLIRELMGYLDLEEITCYMLRVQLEEKLNMPLKAYRGFIDQEMMLYMRQLDAPSQIFDFLYLGSEWNASNLTELKTNGVGYILNVTLEIDNFFPGEFKYMNVRLYDEEGAELLKHWENTHRFICKARDHNSKILIHCKMGVSRSASTVIAFAMKEYGWSLEHAIEEVRSKRSVIKPNDSFMEQLQTYEGILNASKQRWNPKFKNESTAMRSSSENDDKTERPTDQSRDLTDISPANDLVGDAMSVVKASSDKAPSEPLSTRPHDVHSVDSDIISYENMSSSDSSIDNLDNVCPVNASEGSLNDSSNLPASVGKDNSKMHTALPDSPSQVEVSLRKLSGQLEYPLCKFHPSKSPTSEDAHAKSLPELSKETSCGSAHRGLAQNTYKKSRPSSLKELQSSNVPRHDTITSVTPGTVQKVLGKIEKMQQSDFPPRSSSFKLSRRRPSSSIEPLQRSASVRDKKVTDRSGLFDQSSKDCSTVSDTSRRAPQTSVDLNDCKALDKVDFSIGDNSSDEDTVADDTEITHTADEQPKDELCKCKIGQLITSCKSSQCLLKVASTSKFYADDSSTSSAAECPSSGIVASSSRTFEDIGQLNQTVERPLSIHVDSFSSDPFCKCDVSTSPLQRSQSLKGFKLDQEQPSQKKFLVKDLNSSNQNKLPALWKLQRDSLLRSLSGSPLSSKEVT